MSKVDSIIDFSIILNRGYGTNTNAHFFYPTASSIIALIYRLC